jgi:uncharacterized protein YjiS (DUF1127 family)
MLDDLLEIFSPLTDRERRIAALRALTDRELADLGIVRDQIEAYVEGGFAAR